MASFVVLEPTDATLSESAVFVRDGFSLPAFIVPVVWLFLNRLWFESALVLAATILLGLMASFFDLTSATPILGLLVSMLVGFEGANWKIARLRRSGFVEKTVIEAHDWAEAEIRYFTAPPYSADNLLLTPAPLASPIGRLSSAPTLGPIGPMGGSNIGLVGHRGDK